MNSMTDKIKGAANKAMGAVKESVGEATGDRKLRVQGAMQKSKGATQESLGKVKSAVKKAIDRI